MSVDPRNTLPNNGQGFTKTRRNDTYPFIKPEKCNLSGKIALITGASKGIGAALAKSLARAGTSTIVLGARSSTSAVESEIVEAAKKAGRDAPRMLSVELDVGNWDSVDAALAKVKKELGYIDILINNAGFMNKRQMFGDVVPEDWIKTMQVNVIGPTLMIKASLPLLLASPGPDRTVVTLSSGAAHHCVPGASAYGLSKLADIRLMEFLNAEYGEDSEHSSTTGKSILAYAVHPGGIATDLASALPEHLVPLLLTDTVDLASDSMTWLLNEHRSWLAGRYVACQWDMEEFLQKKDEIVKNDLLKLRMAVE